jgi:hypothetical protein
MPPPPPLDVRVRELCQQLVERKTDSQAIKHAEQMQALICERAEELRCHLVSFVTASVSAGSQAAPFEEGKQSGSRDGGRVGAGPSASSRSRVMPVRCGFSRFSRSINSASWGGTTRGCPRSHHNLNTVGGSLQYFLESDLLPQHGRQSNKIYVTLGTSGGRCSFG